MTKKDYIAIAEVINEARRKWSAPHQVLVVEDIQRQLGFLFTEDNPKFDNLKFDNACERTNDEATFVV